MSVFSTYKTPQPRGYFSGTYTVEDRSSNSPNYFNIDFFPTVVGGGRYVIKLKGNGLNLRLNSTVDVEIVDAQGQPIYSEVLDYRDRFNNYYIYFDIYDITAQGLATVAFVGKALYDENGNLLPDTEGYNVRWVKQFMVMPFERNNADLVFDKPPSVNFAQVVGPAQVKVSSTSSAYNYAYTTSSTNQLTIQQSNFQGYDRDFASSTNILDPRLRSITSDPTAGSITSNNVQTAVRGLDNDIQNGNLINYTTRFGTVVTSTSSFFAKEMLGGVFEFYDSASTPTNLQPQLPTNVAVSGSTWSQLTGYKANIVEVINNRQVVIDKPLTIKTIDSGFSGLGSTSTYTYKQATNFKASIVYIPTTLAYVTSSNVSSSYLQFTFSDLNPISGEVYRIKTSYKLSSVTGDFKVLNDQVISPVEYLTDALYPNGVTATSLESDYRLIGYFSTQSYLNDYWLLKQDNPSYFSAVTGSVSSDVQTQAVGLKASFTQSLTLSTQYYQNYNENQLYTLGFYLTLDPYTELEVYMNSNELNTYLTVPLGYPKAFFNDANNEKTRYSDSNNRFGKYLGKITNDRSTKKYYGKVLFDFETDASGLGRPLFRSRMVDEINQTGSAYLSDISIKPYTLNGFTPNLVQYAIQLPAELQTASQLSQSIDFKIDYFDYTGNQSEFSTYVNNALLNYRSVAVSNTCQDDIIYFYYNSGLSTYQQYYNRP